MKCFTVLQFFVKIVFRVSSASWYFLNVFGLRSMYSLILGENNAADQTRIMQEQMSGAAMAMQQDPQKAFKVSRCPLCTVHTSKLFSMLMCIFIFLSVEVPFFGQILNHLPIKIFGRISIVTLSLDEVTLR